MATDVHYGDEHHGFAWDDAGLFHQVKVYTSEDGIEWEDTGDRTISNSGPSAVPYIIEPNRLLVWFLGGTMRSLANTSAVMAALACAILSLSCTDSGDQNTVPDNVDTEASDIPETIPTELPVYEATENCPSEPPDPLTMCEWATAPDGIVFAKVVDTRGFENPAFVREEQRVTTTCSAANKGFELDLVVLETIVGSAPHSISVKLGSDSMDRWGDRPYLDDPNNPKWSQQADSRVLPGMIYGLALYDVGDSWTTAFDPFFARTPGDVLELPDGTQGLCEPMPHWLEGMTVQDLKNSMSLCSGTEGKERRNWVMTAADEAPHQVWAASCLD